MANPHSATDDWSTWLRQYQLGHWDPQGVIDQPRQMSNTDQRGPASASITPVSSRSEAINSEHPPLKSQSTTESQAFFHQNGWLAAPPLRQQHRRLVCQALLRHNLQPQQSPILHLKHAKAVFRCSYAAIIIQTLDQDELLVLAQDGGDAQVQRVPQSASLCSHAMLLPDDKVHVINDSRDDWRFAKCPTALPGTPANCSGKPMNFYASAPIMLSYSLDGVEEYVQVGRFCIMDEKPRDKFDHIDIELLSSIANMASDKLERDFQGSRNAKTAELQQHVGSLIRMVDCVPQSQSIPPSPLPQPAASSDRYNRFSSHLVDHACLDLQHCLGATAVAVFDLGGFRLRPRVSTTNSANNTVTNSSAQLHAPPQPNSTELHTFDVHLDSPLPSLLAYTGAQSCRPNLSTDVHSLMAAFAPSLAHSATQTNLQTRCKFYRKDASMSTHYSEIDVEPSHPTSGDCQDPYSALLPADGSVFSYAVCTPYHPTKTSPGIMFLVMFTNPVCFEQQERIYVEIVTQIAFGSLLRQERSSVQSLQTDFLRHVQHNLRTPLHGALGAVDYLRSAIYSNDSNEDNAQLDLSPDGTLATMLESIFLSGQTLITYIDDLLKFQKLLESRESDALLDTRTRANVAKLVENVVAEEYEFEQRLKKQAAAVKTPIDEQGPPEQIEIIVQASPEVFDAEWMVDPKVFQLIVRKLVSNALRFTNRGYVEITMALAPSVDSSCSSTVQPKTNTLELVVADTGLGMTEAFCAEQFGRPFSKADPFRNGIGLGTAVVSTELKNCGGSFTVASKPDVGTKVNVRCPLQRAPKSKHQRKQSLSTLQRSLAVSKVALIGFETHGLRRLATIISDHLSSAWNLNLISDFSEADCIILPESYAAMLDQEIRHLTMHVKPGTRFVVVSSTHFIKQSGLESLDGRSILLLPVPFGPSSIQVLDTFLTDPGPMEICTVAPAPIHTFIPPGSSISDTTANSDSSHGDDKPIMSRGDAVMDQRESTSTESMDIVPPKQEFRVLVVEDNPINMRLLTTVCKQLNIKYQTAGNGLEAVSKFDSFRPSVVLLDISLPLQDGFEACIQMRAIKHPAFIVAVTALGSKAEKARGLDVCGMDAWLTKPISLRQLKADLEFWKSSWEKQTSFFTS